LRKALKKSILCLLSLIASALLDAQFSAIGLLALPKNDLIAFVYFWLDTMDSLELLVV